jgi:hypothetical protein
MGSRNTGEEGLSLANETVEENLNKTVLEHVNALDLPKNFDVLSPVTPVQEHPVQKLEHLICIRAKKLYVPCSIITRYHLEDTRFVKVGYNKNNKQVCLLFSDDFPDNKVIRVTDISKASMSENNFDLLQKYGLCFSFEDLAASEVFKFTRRRLYFMLRGDKAPFFTFQIDNPIKMAREGKRTSNLPITEEIAAQEANLSRASKQRDELRIQLRVCKINRDEEAMPQLERQLSEILKEVQKYRNRLHSLWRRKPRLVKAVNVAVTKENQRKPDNSPSPQES